MKHVNKFLALALVAGLFSVNLSAGDGVRPEAGEMPAKPIELGEVTFKGRLTRGGTEEKTHNDRVTKVKPFAEKAARAAQDLVVPVMPVKRKASDSAAGQAKVGTTELGTFIDELGKYLVAVRAACEYKDSVDGKMSVPSVKVFKETMKPWVDYANEIEALIKNLEAKKPEIEAYQKAQPAIVPFQAEAQLPMVRFHNGKAEQVKSVGFSFSPSLVKAITKVVIGGAVFTTLLTAAAARILPSNASLAVQHVAGAAAIAVGFGLPAAMNRKNK